MLKKSVLLASLLLLLPLLFQNCAKISFTDLSHSFPKAESTSNTEGNGTGYGGKLTGEFYRFEPAFACEGKEAPVSLISANDQGVILTENKNLFCGAMVTALDLRYIDRSVFQNEIIGYQEGIFKAVHAIPTAIPSNLVEVWCRDRKDRSGIETITHYDRQSQQAVTRIYSAGPGESVQIVSDFSVARVVSQNQVTIRDGNGFYLQVERDKPAAELGLFKATMEALIDGKKVVRETFCRLGGSLDPKIWPARQVVDLKIETFKYSPDFTSLGYTSATGATSPHLFATDLGGTKNMKLTPTLQTRGVTGFEFTPDSRSLVYWADQRLADVPELFKINKDGTGSLQLNPPLSQTNQSLNYQLNFSADGRQVLFSDGHQPTFVDNEMSLSAVPLSGGNAVTLSPPPQGADVSVGDYAVSKKLNKIAFLMGAYSYDIYLSNFDGSDLLKVPLRYPSSGWSILYGETLFIPDPGNYAVVRSMNVPNSFSFIEMLVPMDGSSAIPLPMNWAWHSSNSTGSAVLLTKSSAYKLFHVSDQSTLDLPAIQPQFFSKDGSTLLATETTASGKVQPVSIQVSSGQKTALCPLVASEILKFEGLSDGSWLISAWDEKTAVLSLYLQSGSDCQLKNMLPISKPKIKESVLTSDKQSLVLSMSLTIQDVTHDQLFYVPLNGKIPMQIDSPTYIGAKIANLHVLPDSKSVLYTSDALFPGETNAFLWKAP